MRGSAQEEAERQSGHDKARREGAGVKQRPSLLASTGRTIVLFLLGIAYGTLVSHLHDSQHIAPVHITNIDRSSWVYTLFWGAAGVLLGSLLPYLDNLWRHEPPNTRNERRRTSSDAKKSASTNTSGPSSADWSLAVRSIGAFVGIAFAIRKLPWQSTLQVSATLALANPVLWYLLDRTKPGFFLSAFVGTLGTVALLLINPSIVPEPGAAVAGAAAAAGAANATFVPEGWVAVGRQWLQSVGAGYGLGQGHGHDQAAWAPQQDVAPTLLGGMLSYESVGVATWLGSVLFCSSICFGNVGRKMGI